MYYLKGLLRTENHKPDITNLNFGFLLSKPDYLLDIPVNPKLEFLTGTWKLGFSRFLAEIHLKKVIEKILLYQMCLFNCVMQFKHVCLIWKNIFHIWLQMISIPV